MKNITIGITINIKNSDIIWNNGIAQNVVHLALLFKNSPNNYNVFLANTSTNNQLDYKIEGIDVYPISEKLQEIDILFILGSEILNNHYDILKKKGCKIIFYSCGSNYVIDMQNILFKNETDKKIYKHIPDEIWMIPQTINTNKYYSEVLYRCSVKEIPFVWSPVFIDYIVNGHNLKGIYTPSNEPKRISCFEPNIDVTKFCMYDILIVEEVYRKRPELIKHLYVTNADKIKLNPLFIDIMKMLDVVNSGVATFESRFRMPYFLDTYTDIVIAHQWELPMNYAYLEALYLGYPLVHNAHLMKDGGYYYEKFNTNQGAKKLLYALTEHDKHIEEYNEKSQKVLNRYLPTNEKSIEIYDKMIDDLYKNVKNNILKNDLIKNDLIKDKYNILCKTKSDINEHLPILQKYANDCNHITEMGVRTGVSTWALLSSKPIKMISYDITDVFFREKNLVMGSCKKENIDYEFIVGDSLKINIEETDLLFIDTLHVYNQLIRELKLHNNKVKKYIILHDTTTFGEQDETIYSYASDIVKNEILDTKEKSGLFNAVIDFLDENKNWKIKEKLNNNNGLTVLEKIEIDK